VENREGPRGDCLEKHSSFFFIHFDRNLR